LTFLCLFLVRASAPHRHLHSFPTRRSSDLHELDIVRQWFPRTLLMARHMVAFGDTAAVLTDANWQRAAGLSAAMWESSTWCRPRSEEHTSELQSRENLVCRLLLEKKKQEQR